MKEVLVSIAIFTKFDPRLKKLEVWMQKRVEDGPLNGLWEFPGGKIEPLETPLQAMMREVLEEVEIDLKLHNLPIQEFWVHPYLYFERKIILHIFKVDMNQIHEQTRLDLEKMGRWFDISTNEKIQLIEKIIPSANIPVIRKIALDSIC